MVDITVTDEVRLVIAQLHELEGLILNGSVDPRACRAPLQALIVMKPPVVTQRAPMWYVSPEEQLKHVKRLNLEMKWGFTDADFPSVPVNFTPQVPTEVLLLSVYLPKSGMVGGLRRTFNDLWAAIEPPEGYTKYRRPGMSGDARHLRLFGSRGWRPGIRWVAFDPTSYQKLAPSVARVQVKNNSGRILAGTEVLMAAALFPGWVAGFGVHRSPCPNLSGLQFKVAAGWSTVPFLDIWDAGCELVLAVEVAEKPDKGFTSPTFRELTN